MKKELEAEYVMQYIYLQKANNKYMKNYDKIIKSSYLVYLDANTLHGCGMSQKWLGNGFKWVKKLSKFEKRYIKNYDENSNKGYVLQVDIEYSKNLFSLHKDWKNARSLLVTYIKKKTMLCT